MNKAYRRDESNPRNIFVAHISLCKGIPFYGYHVGWAPYLKVYLINPSYMTKFSDLLRTGAIMGTKMQPHESHIPYLLQFLTDFNLTGCGNIELTSALFRSPLSDDDMYTDGVFHKKSVSPDLILPKIYFPKMSHSGLEIDIDASAIENRKDIVQRNLHHDFKESETSQNANKGKILDSEKDLEHNVYSNIKFVNSLKDIWMDEYKRRHMENMSSYNLPEDSTQRTAPSNSSEFWRRGKELEIQLENLILESRKQNNGKIMNFEKFVRQLDYIYMYPTALETVEEMFTDLSDILQRLKKISMNSHIQSDVELEKEYESEYEDEDEAEAEADSVSGSESEPEVNKKKEEEPAQEQDSEHETDIEPDDDILNEINESDFDFGSVYNNNSKDDSSPSSDNKLDSKMKQLTPGQDNITLPAKIPFSQSSMDLSDIPSEFSIEEAIPKVDFTVPAKRQASLSTETDSNSSNSVIKTARLASRPQTPTETQYTLPQSVSFNTNEDTSFQTAQSLSIASNIQSAFPPKDEYMYIFKNRPPTTLEVLNTFKDYGLPSCVPKVPFFSNPKDIPKEPEVFAGTEFRFKGNTPKDVPPFPFSNNLLFSQVSQCLENAKPDSDTMIFRYNIPPPSYEEVEEWGKKNPPGGKKSDQNKINIYRSQLREATQKYKYGFKYATQRRNDSRKANMASLKYLSSMTIELHTNTRENFHPDPLNDAVQAVFWSYKSEYLSDSPISGCIVACGTIEEEKKIASTLPRENFYAIFERDELGLMNSLIDVVREYDPDILSGYEINSASWGYLIERGRKHLDYDLCKLLSRVSEKAHGKLGDRWGYTHASAIRITGRHMLNVWRVLRNDLNLLKYSIENVAFHTLHRRIPHYSFETLTRWYTSNLASEIEYSIKYHLLRLEITVDLIDTQEIITRTCEEARIIGIDFYSVFYRGSQYKVESILSRITKAENFIMASPSKKQVGEQNAIECLPLILEPETKFYTSPVVVLDFQSLYPSVMIAYNYCYSTCLGRLKNWRGRNKLGFTDLQLPPGLVDLLQKDKITIAPNGMIYVKKSVRKSLLAKMLTEFLNTRVMVKDGMKSNKDDAAFQRLMNNRQLALKLIANVTYGYTSATYSGRMPCVEIADSIVQTGRETMERAIEHIKSNFQKWGAEVVYGDTDSLFVHFPGRTKDEAFDLGHEIADSITEMNPKPMKLKFEKVYYPCILQTKKRYVGYMYEYKDQTTPVFNAKGIETVRRDG